MRFLFIILVCLCCACQNQTGSKKIDTASPLAREIDARWQGIDSMVIVFYDDPYGMDSLRYTRFYTQWTTQRADYMQSLQSQLSEQYERKMMRDSCRGEGKIWCFSNGKIRQTLYFNIGAQWTCRYVYWINDGQFFYHKPLPGFLELLQLAKPLAKKPD
jgi:hypothetical protein